VFLYRSPVRCRDQAGDERGHFVDLHRSRAIDQSSLGGGSTDDVGRHQPRLSKIPDTGVAIRFAQFLRRRFHQQRVMQKPGRCSAAKEPRQLDLPSRRRQQIVARESRA
jgi:hypothetical protein